MQKAIVFISLFLLVIFLSFVRVRKNESFVNFFGVDFNLKNDGTPPQLNSKNATLPVTQPYAPNLAQMGVGNILPGPSAPDSLPTAPYGNMSKAVPTPYKDPTVEPAKYIRILGVKEDLQAFFAFQAGPIEDSSDPSIQMPLTRARADVGELVDIQSVLERNPGLPSRMTNKQLEDIQSNLRYLQSILRDLEASGAVGPTPQGVEGFTGSSATIQDTKPATLEQLLDFQEKVQVEIQRLSASATTDPIITARVSTLTRIAAELTDTIAKVHSGFYTPETVPIYESDIVKALPILGNPTAPLPTILNTFNLPPAIASLFPGGLSPQNKEQAAQINNVVKGYMDQIFEGTSWGIGLNVKYDSPRAEKIYGKNHVDLEVGVPGLHGISEGPQSPFYNYQENTHTGKAQQRQIWDQGVSDSSYDTGLPGNCSRNIPEIQAGGFDWKQRALEITDQVKKRGLDPLLFGAMPSNTVVSESFNWKGYTNMFCNRLAANYDPGVPQSVGCPSPNWPGWKN
jgi:hypothetical protein